LASALARKTVLGMSNKVFVYGTLLHGYGNWSWALQDQTFVCEAETKPEYTMLHLGGFPGIIEGGETGIKGEVYEVSDERLLELNNLEGADLDDPERGMYRRESIVLSDGQEVLTYIYNVDNSWRTCDRIVESGSWREEEPPHDKERYWHS